MRGAFWILGKTYVFFFMPHCFLPFALLTPVSRIWSAIKLTGGLGYVFFGSSFLWIPLIKTALRKPRTDAEPSAKKENWVFIDLKKPLLTSSKPFYATKQCTTSWLKILKSAKKIPIIWVKNYSKYYYSIQDQFRQGNDPITDLLVKKIQIMIMM